MVRAIFELADVGKTNSAIALSLNEKGLARRNGRPGTRRQVAAALREAAGTNESLILLEDEAQK